MGSQMIVIPILQLKLCIFSWMIFFTPVSLNRKPCKIWGQLFMLKTPDKILSKVRQYGVIST